MNRAELLRDLSLEEKNFADFQEMLNNINGGVFGGTIKNKDIFRLQILMIHLFVDNLLENIIRYSPVNDFINYKRQWSVSDLSKMGFCQKLDIVVSTSKFDDNFKNIIITLNDIRNDLAHELQVDIIKQKTRIESLPVQHPFKKEETLNRSLLEQLEISIVPYINLLFEYLIKDIKKKKMNLILGLRTIGEMYPDSEYSNNKENLIFTLDRKVC